MAHHCNKYLLFLNHFPEIYWFIYNQFWDALTAHCTLTAWNESLFFTEQIWLEKWSSVFYLYISGLIVIFQNSMVKETYTQSIQYIHGPFPAENSFSVFVFVHVPLEETTDKSILPKSLPQKMNSVMNVTSVIRCYTKSSIWRKELAETLSECPCCSLSIIFFVLKLHLIWFIFHQLNEQHIHSSGSWDS